MLNGPKKTKFKKIQKGNLPNKLKSKAELPSLGQFSLNALHFGILESHQIEATRRLITKKIKKQGKLLVKIFPHIPKTSKPIEVRMGKGKGSVEKWIAKIKAGTTLYEIAGISIKQAKILEKLCNEKLPIKCKLICFL